MENPSQRYFAAQPAESLLGELTKRVRRYDEWLDSTGVIWRWSRSLKVYHGLKPNDGEHTLNTGRLRATGKQGELTYFVQNHYRNLVQHVLVLVTSNRPALQARAANSDHKSQVQATLGTGVLEFYLRDKRMETNYKAAVEHAILFGEGHVVKLWNPALGEPYVTDPTTGKTVKEGDADCWNPMPNDVIRDTNARALDRSPWRIVRHFVNKYELAERFTEQAEKILATNAEPYEPNRLRSYAGEEVDNDLVPAFWFFHDKSDLLPEGRMTLFVDDAILLDGPLAYERVPVYTVMPSPIPNMPVGYTPAFDGMQYQEAINIIGSSILSNQKAFGVQNVWTPGGGNVSVTQLAGGLNLIQAPEKPEALQLCSTPAELFNWRSELVSEMATIFGVNDVVRGNPEANLKSGAALALVASQAVQFMSGLQQSYNLLIEAAGSGLLRMLQQYAKTKRVANIVGVKGRAYMKDFVGSDLAAAKSVSVEQAPALARTAAGNMQMADNLLDKGMFKRPEEYLAVALTGKLDPLVEDDMAKLLLVRAENEDLLAGKPHMPHVGENPIEHILGHLNLLASPDAKKDPQLVPRVLQAVQAHLELWRTADPAILQILGVPPPPPPGMPFPGMPPQGPAGSPGASAPPMQNPEPPQPQQPNMPSLPQGAPPQAEESYAQLNPQMPPAAQAG
jgi:hypothetical protein